MAQVIKIKRSSSTAAPTSLSAGELAYSSNSQKLFVGAPADGTVTTIGGDLYVAMLDHTAGTLTASSAIIVDSSSKINELKSGNIVVTGSSDTISTSSGNLTIAPTSSLVITHGGTVDLSGQATSLTIPDNQAAALDINEGGTSYVKLVTTNSGEKIALGKNVEVTGTLDVSSSATVNSLSSNGAVSSTGNFDVNTDKFTVAASSGNTVVAGTLRADGDADLNGALDVAGATTLNGAVTLGDASGDAITVTGTATFTPSADFDGGFTVAGSQTVDMGSNRVQNVATPTSSTDAANKGYVDSVKQALDIKDSVRVATQSNFDSTYDNSAGTLTADANGAISIDSVNLSSGDRVLVKAQTTATQNGIYSVTTVGDGSNAAVLTRTSDADSSSDVTGGLFAFVEEGTDGDNAFVLTSVTGGATLGTDTLTFTQFSGAGQVTAGNGLDKSGNTISLNVDNKTIEINSDTARIRGITQTQAGDIIFGSSTANTGYTRLALGTYDSSFSVGQMLQVGASNTVTWSNTIDGGDF